MRLWNDLISDADTGFGGPINVARTAKLYEKAGVAAFHIEDQISPKRCGHLLGKVVDSREDFIKRIKAAVGGGETSESRPIVIAR